MSDAVLPDLVKTSLQAAPEAGPRRCCQCENVLTRRPRGRRDARFCRSGCRAKWHAARRDRLLANLADALTRAEAILRELRGEH